MKLKSFGCSFIEGDELSDFQRRPVSEQSTWAGPTPISYLTYPALLAQHLGMQYECHAEGASGNLRILRNVLKHIDHEPGLFVIQWTFIDRFDFINLAEWPANSWNTFLPVDTSDLAQTYYRNLHSEYRDKISTLIYILTAIAALREHQHRFIMTYVDDLILCNKWHTDPAIQFLQHSVRPYLKQFDKTNWIDWCKQNKFQFGNFYHPLDAAHRATADYIIQQDWV